MISVQAAAVAVEYVESRGNPNVVSRDGCVGLMQVHPRWAKVPRAQLFDPETNRAEGRRLLKYWHGRAKGDWLLTLAAYRCGWGGLRGECGQRYARIVLARIKEK